MSTEQYWGLYILIVVSTAALILVIGNGLDGILTELRKDKEK